MENSVRKRLVRQQKDGMVHYIEASKRGDRRSMKGAMDKVIETGKKLGSRASGRREWMN